MERKDGEARSAPVARRTVFGQLAALAGTAAAAQLGGCAGENTPQAAPDASILTQPSLDTVYDYIVVGSGAGGGPLAANLARAGRRVLVIEAGSATAGGPAYDVPVYHAHATEHPDMRWDFAVQHYTNPPEKDPKYWEAGGGILYPRAATLGGCTAHNAMIMVYPDDRDWDDIAALVGDQTWSSGRMRAYFQRLERCTYRPAWTDALEDRSGHGYDGWLPTSRAASSLAIRDPKLVDLIRAAAAQVGVDRVIQDVLDGLLDPNDKRIVGAEGGREGLFLTPLAVGEGRRHGTRERLLETVRDHPGNLAILTHALATRIVFDGNRAVGVECLLRPSAYRADPRADRGTPWPALQGELRTIRASREVILAGGAFNSPQLLMLSGIGPADQLRRLGIPVRIDRPGVGRNLQDRYEVTVTSKLDSPLSILASCTLTPPRPGAPDDPCYTEWLKSQAGIYATNGVVIGIITRSRPTRALPDLYVFGLPGKFRGYEQGYAEKSTAKDSFCWAILKAHTRNVGGEVRLRSADPRDTPSINFHYFEEGGAGADEDLDSMVAGVQFARAINRRLRIGHVEDSPGPECDTPEKIAAFVRREAWGHHASCSNKMGPAADPMAVVDSRFRVHGCENLRIVDASVFPRIPGLFIVTAVYMISEKASDVILAG